MRRSWTSVGLNSSEGLHQRGAKQGNRLDDAMGSARETHTGLRMANALGYLQREPTKLLRDIDQITAILYRRSRPRR